MIHIKDLKKNSKPNPKLIRGKKLKLENKTETKE